MHILRQTTYQAFFLKSITEYYFTSQRTPVARVYQTGISFYLQNLKPEKGIGRNSILYNRYSLHGVCWISKKLFHVSLLPPR